ncbi:MAG TPA: hypothetical protein PKE51_04075 [Gemmatimonadaceae bacterium]|nr:hypothetical protein [Gemmatimonadaceae bacterium]
MTDLRLVASPSRRTSRTRAHTLRLLLGAGLLFGAASASAQGALSTQGFGYPPGGLSARALGTSGATGEFDLLSTLNPAAINDVGSGVVTVQGQPETRTLRVGDLSERSRIQRIPMVGAGLRVRQLGFMISASTLLDRTFATQSEGTAIVDGRTVPTVDDLEARGAITELRFGAGWSWRSLRLGAAAIAVTGDNTAVRARTFPDSLGFGSVLDTASSGYQGFGASLGVNWRPLDGLLLAGSWRVGGRLEGVRGDSVLSRASVPDRLGAGVLYDGLRGTVLAASIERVGWSAMNGLGSDASQARDATNWSVGAEFVGGSLRAFPVLWRVGYANRALPFSVGTAEVTERGLSAGLGLPIVGEQGVVDVAVQRLQRRMTGDAAREDAWALTVGLTIRP